MEHVVSFYRILIHAEDQINPRVQIVRNIGVLQSAPMLLQEIVDRAGPSRVVNVVDVRVLGLAQVELQSVDEHVALVRHEELGDQFFDAAWTGHALVPLLRYTIKNPVRIVEPAGLELDHPLWILPDVEADNVAGRAVVRLIQAFLCFIDRVIIIILLEVLQSFGVTEGANWLRKVSVCGVNVLFIQHIGRIILQYPRHHRILRQILKTPLRERIQHHQVVEVA